MSKASTPRTRPTQARILAAASELFYAEGLAATGIDAVTARAGVAKMSLYNNFASKEELVAAYLEARHAEWLGLYERRAAEATTPQERALAVFDAYADHARFAYPSGFRGCGLLNAAAELPVGHPGRQAVRGHKEQVEALLRDALIDLGTLSADLLDESVEHLALLLEGSMAKAGLEGNDRHILRARRLAQAIVAELTATGSTELSK
ncbi:TetR/AcrR family transcriptional regulator [Lysinibacter cavernae]|uniref:AcrR family transcriptional regulator n=1 Tax=Lysinibacter cavernae TaxID=1640652 RepID=A0A7X5QZM7_9MICO|nr:TetR/AcrR family transcriptional regulator [Lysinibacter cavernae]NIH52745.1 AcrR family transcriptional regulator [Lysinibacter cavernae]